MQEPIRIEDFRREEARHDAEHFPDECRESFANIARATMRRWASDDLGAFGKLILFPVICREFIRDLTGEDVADFSNDQITFTVICIMRGGCDIASDNLTEFLTDWLWRGETLR